MEVHRIQRHAIMHTWLRRRKAVPLNELSNTPHRKRGSGRPQLSLLPLLLIDEMLPAVSLSLAVGSAY